MRRIFRNHYKRPDIFSCHHSSHHRFGSAVTPHHILNEKKCYPNGCIVFKWKCRRLDKGHACPKKFGHVGRKCFSCKEFFEDKYMQAPQLRISEDEYARFRTNLEDLDFWLNGIVGNEIELEATFAAVKPNLRASGTRNQFYHFVNWLAIFESAHVNYDLFDDACFARMSEKTQSRYRFKEGDRILCRATPIFDRGRLIFTRLHGIEATTNHGNPEWDRARVEVAAATASRIDMQTEKCLACRYGCLIDMNGNGRSPQNRSLLCLAGQKLPEECAYPLMKFVESGNRS